MVNKKLRTLPRKFLDTIRTLPQLACTVYERSVLKCYLIFSYFQFIYLILNIHFDFLKIICLYNSKPLTCTFWIYLAPFWYFFVLMVNPFDSTNSYQITTFLSLTFTKTFEHLGYISELFFLTSKLFSYTFQKCLEARTYQRFPLNFLMKDFGNLGKVLYTSSFH